MEYKCFLCCDTFDKIENCLKHLKICHNYVDGINEFICIVNNQCSRSFTSIKSLKAHMKTW